MSDLQKNIIENFLKEKKKTKRDLAKLLGIKENSINRTLKNSNISLSKLSIIADFLGVELNDLLPKKNLQEPDNTMNHYLINSDEIANQQTLGNLSEALSRSSRTIENLVKIIAENYTDKKDSY
jgi:transcriptional regulator with XRE-family HTH domain